MRSKPVADNPAQRMHNHDAISGIQQGTISPPPPPSFTYTQPSNSGIQELTMLFRFPCFKYRPHPTRKEKKRSVGDQKRFVQ